MLEDFFKNRPKTREGQQIGLNFTASALDGFCMFGVLFPISALDTLPLNSLSFMFLK